MTITGTLFQLEQLDLDLERREAEIRDLRRREARNPELEALEARLDALRRQERAAAAEQRTLESDLTDVEAKIKRDQTRMYSGQIVDSRELASLERELAHHSARRDTLEEQCLTAMERVEQLQGEVAAAARQANELRQRWEVERPALGREAESITDALPGMRAERERLAASLDPRTLDHYRRLRASAGHAISRVTGGVCQWCRVVIPPKDVQHARSDQLVTCTNCARILYVSSEL